MLGLSTSKHFNPVPLALLCKNLLSVLVVVLFVSQALAKQAVAVPVLVDSQRALVEAVAPDAGFLRQICPSQVLGMRNGLEVIRPDALAIAAKMVNLGAFRNGPVGKSIGNSVRVLLPSSVDVSVTVALGSYKTGPVPTGIGFIYFAPKQFGCGFGRAFALTEACLAAVTGKRTFRPELLSTFSAIRVRQYSGASSLHIFSYYLRTDLPEGFRGVNN